ncbi:MAG: TonB-dependent receptor [Candidatus Methylacidiphilales bacterium]
MPYPNKAAQKTTDAPSAGSSLRDPIINEGLNAPPVTLEAVTVFGQLDEARQKIVPSLGATVYSIDQTQIQSQAQGENVPFNKLLLRFPGVSQDSLGSGAVHIRNEHSNIQYRINDVLIPEGITGFGNEFDTRFVDRVDLITGALPAQFGLRTAGIVDIHTKSGALNPGGTLNMYGGSNETLNPSMQYGGTIGKTSFYVSGSYLHSTLGIENPTSSRDAIHDTTEQFRGFAYISHIIDDTSRISLITGASYKQFEIPNTPGLQNNESSTFFPTADVQTFDSAALNERQREQNNYEVLAYQKTVDALTFQVALFNRYSQVSFDPDWQGDLFFNGVAGSIDKSVMSNGLQFDGSYELNDCHTLRGGLIFNYQGALQVTNTSVFATDEDGEAVGDPFMIADRSYQAAFTLGLYLQDEWKITRDWTVNYGGRFDLYLGQTDQNQFSPRINTTYQLSKNTSIHAGYASYFTPPSLENTPSGAVSKFAGTTNAADPDLPNDPAQAERSHYFDIGIVHKFTPAYQVGIDAYYKKAQNQLDNGQFGAAPILSVFNYREGEIFGLEISQSYTQGGLSAYANFSLERGIGKGFNSSQAIVAEDPEYVDNHFIYLDHDQRFSGAVGVSYLISQIENRPYVEMICGSGLRNEGAVPNGGTLPAYCAVNMGFEQSFKFIGAENLKFRMDVLNLFDQTYQLRDGTGIGAGAAQYGQRRSIYGGMSYSF